MLVLVTLLASCGSEPKVTSSTGQETTVAAPEAGQCIAEEIKDANDSVPDFESVVPCTEPHTYEILGTVDIPETFLDDSSTEASTARRTELATIGEQSSKLTERMRTELYPQCADHLLRATGTDRVKVQGKPATGEVLLPRLGTRMVQWFSLTPLELWRDGAAQVVCSIRFQTVGGDEPAAVPMTSSSDAQVIGRFLGPVPPLEAHSCLRANDRKVRPCDRPHMGERLWALNIDALLGPSVLDGGTDSGESKRITRLCSDTYASVGGNLPRGRQMLFSSTEKERNQGRVTCTVVGSDPGKNTLPAGFNSL